MKKSQLTVRVDQALERQLDGAAKRSGRSGSEMVRDALRRQLALEHLADLRRRVKLLAKTRGYLSESEILGKVS
jgi:predicted transcriptional regulator